MEKNKSREEMKGAFKFKMRREVTGNVRKYAPKKISHQRKN